MRLIKIFFLLFAIFFTSGGLLSQTNLKKANKQADRETHDGLVVVKRVEPEQVKALPFFVEVDKGREAHGRPSSDWGRKVHGYNRFFTSNWKMHPQLTDLPDKFPRVLVVTHGKNRLLNLGRAITKHRKEPVVYYLATWDDVMTGADFLTAPAWLVITEEGKIIGKDPAQRRPLLPASGNGTDNDQDHISEVDEPVAAAGQE